jgi:hypothetical protein
MTSNYLVCVDSKNYHFHSNDTNPIYHGKNYIIQQNNAKDMTVNDILQLYFQQINHTKIQPQKICSEVSFETDDFQSVDIPIKLNQSLTDIPSVYPEEYIGDDISRKFITVYW